MAADPPTLTIARLSRVLENHATDGPVAVAVPRARAAGQRARAGRRPGGPPGRHQADADRPRRRARRARLRDPRDAGRRPPGRAGGRSPTPDGRPPTPPERGFRDGARRGARVLRRPRGRADRASTSCVPPSTPAGRQRRGAATPRPADPTASTSACRRASTTADRAGRARRRRPVRRSGVHAAGAGRTGVGWLRRLRPFFRRYKGTIIATFAFSIIAQVLIGLLPLIQQRIVDDSIISDDVPLGPMLVLLVLTGVLGFCDQLPAPLPRRQGQRPPPARPPPGDPPPPLRARLLPPRRAVGRRHHVPLDRRPDPDPGLLLLGADARRQHDAARRRHRRDVRRCRRC